MEIKAVEEVIHCYLHLDLGLELDSSHSKPPYLARASLSCYGCLHGMIQYLKTALGFIFTC
jgi:hypothetical protein